MPLPPRKNNTSFVLVVVLGMLVLIIILVVGFLAHVTSQTKSSTSYRDQTGTLLLSDVAVNVVKAQIDAGTTGSSQSGPTTALWASQPGAIRSVAYTGTVTTYKLYSSANLVETATGSALKTIIAGDLPTTTAIAANDWSSSGLWTDLNAPGKKSDGTYAYPIIDVYNDTADLPTGSTTTPPFATGNFNIDSGNILGASRSAVVASPYRLPMPVRWLYVLKQGQVIAPDANSTDTLVTFNSANPQPVSNPGNPALDNPIVGRIAFWTDDDTCRVNINTASVGTFWDTPRFTSPDDLTLALNQPVYKEFQRYPGHAAMTTLTLALPEFLYSPGPENAIALTPRYYTGGSKEGIVATTSTSAPLGATVKSNRLYASVDELLFDAPPTSTGVARTVSATLSKKQVEAAKFFLTAHSRAPELNLFGEPRVAMWPISSQTNTVSGSYRTVTDSLIGYCASTTGTTTGVLATNNYFFTRAPHNNAVNNGGWIAGLDGSNSPTADVNLPRNTAILSYLDYFGAQPTPGNLSGGVTYDTKYTQLGMRQILTEIFDYIRIINPRDPLLDPFYGKAFPPANNAAANVPYAAYSSVQYNPMPTNGFSQGQIQPSYNSAWGTYGYGRSFNIVIGATLDFVAVGQGLTNGYTTYTNAPPNYNYHAVATNQVATTASLTVPWTGYLSTPQLYTPPPNVTAVQAVLTVDMFDPALGFTFDSSSYTVGIAGLDSLALNGQSLAFPASGTVIHQGVGNQIYNGSLLAAGSTDSGYDTLGNPTTGKFGVSHPFYPFYSTIVNITNTASPQYMTLSNGKPITITVYPLDNPPGSTLGSNHVYKMDLGQISSVTPNLPTPLFGPRPVFGSLAPRSGGGSWTNYVSDRFDTAAGNDSHGEAYNLPIDSYDDTVVSMVPSRAYGDYRMLADATNSSAAFVPHPLYGSGNRLAYGQEQPEGGVWRGAVGGALITNTAYYTGTLSPVGQSAMPVVPATVTSPTSGNGNNVVPTGLPPPDFDNGFGPAPDGPYINKPDEGNYITPTPYYYKFGNIGFYGNLQSFVSPERQASSPVMFGSLPTGAPVQGSTPKPWQTLLFQPGMTGHAGLAAPKDEYLLDLFWMPQAEPYAISEPFSTAGKVNLNYQILPFTYIDRSTAIQSVLASEKVAAVPTSLAGTYKNITAASNTSTTMAMTTSARFPLNTSEVNGTLRPFAQKFANMDFFHAPSEICDVYLVPNPVPAGEGAWTSDPIAQGYFYGPDFGLVGDNTRERPYSDIYARVTTKSNSYTVYYRVQTLKNPSTSTATTWTEGQGAILGDFRGSTTLERYIDPNDLSIPDYATTPTAPNLETHYKWRVVENTRFAP